jgi:hypothetical protein
LLNSSNCCFLEINGVEMKRNAEIKSARLRIMSLKLKLPAGKKKHRGSFYHFIIIWFPVLAGVLYTGE